MGGLHSVFNPTSYMRSQVPWNWIAMRSVEPIGYGYGQTAACSTLHDRWHGGTFLLEGNSAFMQLSRRRSWWNSPT